MTYEHRINIYFRFRTLQCHLFCVALQERLASDVAKRSQTNNPGHTALDRFTSALVRDKELRTLLTTGDHKCAPMLIMVFFTADERRDLLLLNAVCMSKIASSVVHSVAPSHAIIHMWCLENVFFSFLFFYNNNNNNFFRRRT